MPKKNNHFQHVYQQFIFKSRYAKYIEADHRREEWDETISRYFNFFQDHLKERCNFNLKPYRAELETGILDQKVMPSMRGLMTAGPALKRDEAAVYNCAFLPIDNVRAFDEELMVLMLGTGVGFSVESEDTINIPQLPDTFHDSNIVITFDDSRIGWAKGYREFVALLLNGQVAKYDISKLRPKGARLKTFGGRSSGPAPLVELLEFTKVVFFKAAGRKLTTLECHDIVCKVADIVVVGGVRRSALISLSDISDDRMRVAKSGEWWNSTPHRRLANNSAVYEDTPDIGLFMKEWVSLYESKSGERGIFSRKAAKHVIDFSNAFRMAHFGPTVRTRDATYRFGSNPCCEIILRPYEFCNLTSVQVRATDSLETLKEKVRLATILGTMQSTLTKFRYLNKKWQKNCEDERLLGVSLNGVFDNTLMNGKQGLDKLKHALTELRKVAIATNIEWAAMLGIPTSAAITCIKPEGTTSALNMTASGLHTNHAPYYFRYVRNDRKDPLTQFMMDAGIPWEEDAYDPSNMIAFKFPMKAPEGALCRKDISAIEHLELWKIYQEYYCEHKPSVTITVKEDEWFEVGAWVYKNFEWMSGISFLPYNDHIYKQAPFTDCSKDEYEELLSHMPTEIDWSRLADYEKEDSTTNAQTLACTGTDGCFV